MIRAGWRETVTSGSVRAWGWNSPGLLDSPQSHVDPGRGLVGASVKLVLGSAGLWKREQYFLKVRFDTFLQKVKISTGDCWGKELWQSQLFHQSFLFHIQLNSSPECSLYLFISYKISSKPFLDGFHGQIEETLKLQIPFFVWGLAYMHVLNT